MIQRADIFKKAKELGFGHLDIHSNPQTLGAALLEHWRRKVEDDATYQNVDHKRIFVLLNKTGLQGIRNKDQMCVYRWYPN